MLDGMRFQGRNFPISNLTRGIFSTALFLALALGSAPGYASAVFTSSVNCSIDNAYDFNIQVTDSSSCELTFEGFGDPDTGTLPFSQASISTFGDFGISASVRGGHAYSEQVIAYYFGAFVTATRSASILTEGPLREGLVLLTLEADYVASNDIPFFDGVSVGFGPYGVSRQRSASSCSSDLFPCSPPQIGPVLLPIQLGTLISVRTDIYMGGNYGFVYGDATADVRFALFETDGRQVEWDFLAGPDEVSAIPEPSSFLLAAGGFAALLFRFRRRRSG